MNRFSRSLRRYTSPLCLALSVAALTVSTSAVAASNWNPQHILAAFENPYVNGTKDVGVISHRGIVASGCPENSTCSIEDAYNQNVEAVELDVKEDSQGALWLFHDQNAGRLLDHNPEFNIFQPAANPQGWNPDISTMTSQELGGSYLRDLNFIKSQYHPVTLGRALQDVQQYADHLLVVLDIKTPTAVASAANIVHQLGMQRQVVLKFSSSMFARNPANMSSATRGVPFVPTVYAADEDRIADNYTSGCYGTDQTPECRVNSWVAAAKNAGASWIEIGNKAPREGDPTWPLLQNQADMKRAIGAFSPVPEYRTNSNDGHYYVRSNATCCASLDDYLTRTKYFGNETVDQRTNYSEQVLAGATNVITDDPLTVIQGVHRDTSRYQ